MIRKHPLLLSLLLALALALSACTGSVPSAGWPGLSATDQLAFVAFNQQLHAVNLSNGREAWAFPAQPSNNVGLLFTPPALSADLLLVGSEGPTNSFSGAVYALRPDTGQQVWCLVFDKKGADRTGCASAAGADSGGLFAATSDNRLLGGIALARDAAYFGLSNGKVFAVSVETGQVLWSFSAEHAIWAAPVVDDGSVYIASLDHHVYALDRAAGTVNWKTDLGAAVAGTPALIDGTLYVGTFGSRVAALDAATGQEQWSTPTQNWVWGGPTVTGGLVYFSDLSGGVTALEAATGAMKWSVTPGGVMTASPLVTAQALYIGDRAGKLFALDPATGATLTGWPLEVGGELLGAPLAAGESLLIAPYKGDNLLAAYPLQGGLLTWAFAPTTK